MKTPRVALAIQSYAEAPRSTSRAAAPSGHVMQRQGSLAAVELPKAAKKGGINQSAVRVLEAIKRSAEHITAPGAEVTLIDKNAGAKARSTLFAIESLMRMANVRYGGKFEKRLERVKELEDAMGALGHAMDMQAQMPAPDLIDYWAARETDAREQVTDVLRERWLPRSAGDRAQLPKLVRDVIAPEWASAIEDKRANAKSLLHEVEAFLEKAPTLDMSDIDQVHELRRACRWFAILARALNGAVELTPGGPEGYRHFLDSPAAKLPFADLPTSAAECHPVRVSRCLWIAGGNVIEEIGKLKDTGEAYLGVREALMEQRGMGEKAAHREALRLLGITQKERDGWTAKAEKLRTEAIEVFGAIRDELRAQAKRA